MGRLGVFRVVIYGLVMFTFLGFFCSFGMLRRATIASAFPKSYMTRFFTKFTSLLPFRYGAMQSRSFFFGDAQEKFGLDLKKKLLQTEFGKKLSGPRSEKRFFSYEKGGKGQKISWPSFFSRFLGIGKVKAEQLGEPKTPEDKTVEMELRKLVDEFNKLRGRGKSEELLKVFMAIGQLLDTEAGKKIETKKVKAPFTPSPRDSFDAVIDEVRWYKSKLNEFKSLIGQAIEGKLDSMALYSLKVDAESTKRILEIDKLQGGELDKLLQRIFESAKRFEATSEKPDKKDYGELLAFEEKVKKLIDEKKDIFWVAYRDEVLPRIRFMFEELEEQKKKQREKEREGRFGEYRGQLGHVMFSDVVKKFLDFININEKLSEEYEKNSSKVIDLMIDKFELIEAALKLAKRQKQKTFFGWFGKVSYEEQDILHLFGTFTRTSQEFRELLPNLVAEGKEERAKKLAEAFFYNIEPRILELFEHFGLGFGRRREARREERIDPYKVLGISPGANEVAIKNAYRGLVKKYHPDIAGAAYDQEKWLAIQKAYDTLMPKK